MPTAMACAPSGHLRIAVLCQLLGLACSSYPRDQNPYEQRDRHTDDFQFVIPGQLTKEQLEREHEARERAARVAEWLDRGGYKWTDDPEVAERASSLAQTVSSEVGNASSAAKTVAGHSWAGACKHIPVIDCGKQSRQACIKRARTTKETAKVLLPKVLGKLEVTMMLALGVVVSAFIFGMFSAFFSYHSAMLTTGLIASCHTVINTAIYHSMLQSTLALTVGLGVTGGLLSQAVTSQTGLAWSEIQRQQELAEDLKFAHEQEDTCDTVVFHMLAGQPLAKTAEDMKESTKSSETKSEDHGSVWSDSAEDTEFGEEGEEEGKEGDEQDERSNPGFFFMSQPK